MAFRFGDMPYAGGKRSFTRSGLALGPRAPPWRRQRSGAWRGRTGRMGYRTVARTRGWAGARSEMKYFDTTKPLTVLVAATTWAGTELDPGTFDTFCVPVKGTGINERIGRQIEIHKIKINAHFFVGAQANQTATDSAALVRLALYLDTQTNSAQAQGEQVFEDVGTASISNNCMAFQSLDTLGRFRMLKDKRFVMQNPNLAYDGTNMEQNGLIRSMKINHTFRNPIKVHFNETNGGTVADIVDNSLHLIAATTNTGLAVSIIYEARVSYKDPQ